MLARISARDIREVRTRAGSHLRRNKRAYIAGAAGFAAGAVLSRTHSRELVVVNVNCGSPPAEPVRK